MVEGLVIVAAEGIHKKLVSIAANELFFAWGYTTKLDTLEHSLKLICAKLRDTKNEKAQNHGVMVWLAILNHVIAEADDLLDDLLYEMLKHEVMTRDQTRMTAFRSVPSLKTFSIRREMGHRIENITNKFSEMIEQGNKLGLQNRHPRLAPDGVHQETDFHLDEFKFVGRRNDELRIIQLLTESRKEEKITVVSILGMDGIGKTTLVKAVYNNPIVMQQFDVRVWLCVSVKVDVNTLLAKICESLPGEECKSLTRVNLITNLQKKLGSKKYLVVLDDFRDKERTSWDEFRSCMLKVNSLNGSCFLVTTKNLEMGTKAFSEDFHALQGLPVDECWSIFKESVFVAGQSCLWQDNHGFHALQGLPVDECWSIFKESVFVAGQSWFPELEEIGRDIVNNCRGLPLLVKVIGGMLRSCNDTDKWLSIKDSEAWDLEENEHVVQNILKLSFHNLPNCVVKQCFTYCSIFKKDGGMNNNELIQLWMASGLVVADESTEKEMEDVGNDIFQILVRSSMFQDLRRDVFGYFIYCGTHELTYCGMHDLVHDLSLSFANHESSCMMFSTADDIEHIPHVNHLSVHRHLNKHYESNTKVSTLLKDHMTTRNLYTLFFEGEVEKNISYQRFKCIRILKFSGCKLEILDDSVGELVHLRYLDLSITQIIALPKSIGKLYHLQTLKLIGCYHLHQWPVEMGNLISLRVLEFPKLLLIHMLGQLTSLRTLPFFGVLKQKGYQIEELGRLKHLRGEIQLFNLENINSKEDALKACLSEKKKLYKIEFLWSMDRSANCNDEHVLEGLQPHGNVKRLTIGSYSGDKFPQWVMKMAIDIKGKWAPLHNLVEIILSGCRSCLYLPMLEHLPLLRDLELMSMDSLTSLRSSSDQGGNVTRSMNPLSPSLRSLKVGWMKMLENWTDTSTNNSTMISPVLEKLQIQHCPKIIFLDECHPHPLVSLEIHYCENLMSLKSIQGLTSLESLEIHNCPSLLELPDLPNHGVSLKSLRIICCHKLTYLPSETFHCFSFLTKLSLGHFSNELKSFPSLQGIDKLRNHLHSLDLYGWHHWECIPEEIRHLTSLTQFFIFNFGMRELPIWLTNMSSIRVMRFYDCHGLDQEAVKLGAPREADHVFLNKNRM